jgi:hypothetical protein
VGFSCTRLAEAERRPLLFCVFRAAILWAAEREATAEKYIRELHQKAKAKTFKPDK